MTIGTSYGAAKIDSIGPGLYSMSGTGQGVAAETAALYAAEGTTRPRMSFNATPAERA